MKMLSALLLVGSVTPPAFAQGWPGLGGSETGLGISGNEVGYCDGPSAGFMPDTGFPAVAYVTGNYSYVLLFRFWDGSAWTGLKGSDGPTPVGNVSPGNPSLAFDTSGRPVIAWQSGPTPARIFLKSFDGAEWVALGGSASGNGIGGNSDTATLPSLAIGTGGEMFVAWENKSSSTYTIRLKRYDAERQQWLPMGPGGTEVVSTGTKAHQPSLAVGSDGLPVVAFVDQTETNYQLLVRTWDPVGLAWTGIKGSDGPGGLSQGLGGSAARPRLRVDLQGRPVVCWTGKSFTGSQAVYLKRLNPDLKLWEGLGGSAAEGGLSGTAVPMADDVPSLSIDAAGNPTVLWLDSPVASARKTLLLLRWNEGSGSWDDVGGSSTGTAITPSATLGLHQPTLAADGIHNHLFVSWVDAQQPLNDGYESLYGVWWPNRAPSCDGPPAQFRLDGVTPIPPGGLTLGETGFTVSLLASDPDHDPILLEVQVGKVGEAPADDDASAATEAGPEGLIVAKLENLLELGQSYWWRVRAADSWKAKSPWTPFMSPTYSEVDLFARVNHVPAAGGAGQARPDGAPLASGSKVMSLDDVRFEGSTSDEDGDRIRLEVEIVSSGSGYDGIATASGSYADGGTTLSALHAAGVGPKSWRYRYTDSYGGSTAWTTFGDNPESEPDFSGIPNGSIGEGLCGASAAGAAWPAILALLLAPSRAIFRRPAPFPPSP